MKDFNYIDKIIYDKLSDMKVPVEKSWGEIESKLNSVPQVHTPVNKSFWSSTALKVIGFASVITIGVTSFFVFNTNNKINSVVVPQKSTYEVSNIRDVVNKEILENTNLEIKEENINNQNTTNNLIADNNKVVEIPKKDSIKVITVIDVNKVVIDTLKQK